MNRASVNQTEYTHRYLERFVTIVLILGYTMIHLKLAGVLKEADLSLMYHGEARLPFGQRLLVPMLARGLGNIFPLSIEELFFLLELFFVSVTTVTLKSLLSIYFKPRQTTLLTWLFLLMLPLVFVVNYRLLTDSMANIYFPYDSASLFFTLLGFFLCLRRSWWWLLLCITFATFNRESSILLVLLIPCLHWRNGVRSWWLPFTAGFLIFLTVKCIIWQQTAGLPGDHVEWFFRDYGITNFHANYYYLTQKFYLFYLGFAFAGIPYLLFAFYDFVPHQFRPLRWLCLAYFIGLTMVGHLIETRIFGEIVCLLFLPTVIAILSWLNELPPLPEQGNRLYCLIDRYGIVLILMSLLVFAKQINKLALFLSNHV